MLGPGTRLGVYEVVAPIGAGGMGEVLKARDTKLGRDVAIKVLPAALTNDPERLARFQREAQVLAALNHPNIAAIYHLEEADGAPAIVMELVEGETLGDRIARGPIPIDEALSIAKQIAEALEAAHEQGIIHRDLKPANIKVRSDGAVKVLDFGLAKLVEPPAVQTANPSSLSMSPTITSPALVSGVGALLGTAAYMSPEQAKGGPADKRSDIWAFGCLLYEMLTGQRLFDGEDATDALVAVLGKQPIDWNGLPADTPMAIRTLLARCVERNPAKRARDMAVALVLIDEAVTPVVPGDKLARNVERRLSPLPRAVAYGLPAFIVGGLVTFAAARLQTPSVPAEVVRTTIVTSGAQSVVVGGSDNDIAITPDGARVVYRGDDQVFVRALGQLEPTALTGLGTGPHGLFLSPDGAWVGFFDQNGNLKKVRIDGGPPVTLARSRGGSRGATWNEDSTIVFGTNAPDTGLLRVSAAGGDPVVIAKPSRERGEGSYRWPEFLPGGKSVLFTILPTNGSVERADIAILDLASGQSKVVVRGGTQAHYISTGHLVYGIQGTLRAVPFNLARLETTGAPFPVLQGVAMGALGAVDVAIARNGTLVYLPGTAAGGTQLTIASVDASGRESKLPGIPLDSYRDVRVSPDGTRVALATQEDVWVYDISRATMTRLTTDPGSDTRPLWTPDGKRIVFSSTRNGSPQLFWRSSDGTGHDDVLYTHDRSLGDLRANGWSADGSRLLFGVVAPGVIRCEIGELPVERPSEAKLLVTNGFCNDFSAISPDGRWLAYHSNLSGRYEIYVERYPELGTRQQVSTDGGWRPVWSRDGRQLFFSTPDNRQMLGVPMQPGKSLVIGRPTPLFDLDTVPPGGGTRHYDIGLDGRFFVIRNVNDTAGTTIRPIVVIQNWFEELKRVGSAH